MGKHRPILLRAASLTALGCALLLAWSLAGLQEAVAQTLPPPPTKTPVEPTLTPLTPPATTPPTDTPVPPTDTPVPPTNTPVPPTNTPIPPTNTPVPPTNSPIPPTTTRPPSQPPSTPRPDPNCQSVVEGNVFNSAGQRARGATVSIEGAGWSRTMATDDNGHFGFGGLCAGTATLRATLLSGQSVPAVTVTLNGKNHLQVTLSAGPTQATAPVGATATATRPAAQPTSTAEANMPATGYSGWLLVGGALLGAALLFLAGARRVLSSREGSRDG